MVRVDRVTGETMSVRPTAGARESRPLRWHWDTPLVQSPHDPKVVFAAANKVFRSADRGISWTAVSGDLTDGANRDDIVTMGVKGSEIRFSRNDGIQAVADDRLRSRSRRSARASTTPAPMTAICQVSRDARQDVDEGVRQAARELRRACSCLRSCRHGSTRGDGLRHARRPSAERLRDLHLREHRFRRDVATAQREPEGARSRGRSPKT